MNSIVRNRNRLHSIHYLTQHARKGVKVCLKKLIVEDECGKNNVLLDRSAIEEKIIESDARHFQQAKNYPTFTDKMHDKFTNELVRDKILNGTLRRNEYDANELCEFLKLLKQTKDSRNEDLAKISEELFLRVVKCSKKRSASSVISGRTYAACKYSALSKRMLRILVMFCNMILMQIY